MISTNVRKYRPTLINVKKNDIHEQHSFSEGGGQFNAEQRYILILVIFVYYQGTQVVKKIQHNILSIQSN